jgi:hypothetical protein
MHTMWYMTSPLVDVDETIREIETQTDRGAAILAAALIDDHLIPVIETKFHPLSKTVRDRLIGEFGALGNFSIKIDLAFALSLYGEITMSDLHIIRRIRNRFAHRSSMRSFDHPDIKKLVSLIKLPDKYPPGYKGRLTGDPRQRFQYCVAVIIGALGEMLVKNPRYPPSFIPMP